MKPKEFVTWLKGFVTACNAHLPTPAQWDELVETLNKVDLDSKKMTVFDEEKSIFLGKITTSKDYWQTNTNKDILHD